jgi:hypothetical protein
VGRRLIRESRNDVAAFPQLIAISDQLTLNVSGVWPIMDELCCVTDYLAHSVS